jgi:4,5-DOPA dioxygenase extradiol
MTSTMQAPVLFISHGAPTFAVEPGVLGSALTAIGQQLTGIRAVLVVSPHWQTRSMVTVMTTPKPETVHDFGGFPAALYQLQYPAAGSPDIAHEAARLLTAAGFATELDARRGLDHGAWVPLMHLLPRADVPVFQVSMPLQLTTQQALQMGQALASLRDQGVLIVASGSMTHNLYEIEPPTSPARAYATEFAQWVQTAVLANAVQPLVHYRREAPHAERAHPTEEHFLPMLVALGAQGAGDRATFIPGGITHGVLSMDSYLWQAHASR